MAGIEQPAELGGVRGLLRRRLGPPYKGADMGNAKRLGALVWLIGTAIAVVGMPFQPPTEPLGPAGWVVAAALVAVAVIAARQLIVRPESVGPGGLLAMGYAGIAQIGMFDWLAGGFELPYRELFLIWTVFTGCLHPIRRVVPFLGFVLLVAGAPLVYEGSSPHALGELATSLLLWFSLAFIGMLLVRTFWAQRLSLRRESERANRLARVDALTGLGNRRAFNEALEAEVARAERTSRPLSVMVVDLDDFKEINDRWGHIKGDEYLHDVGGKLQGVVRRPDACFRWGGDEFAVLLSETPRQGATRVCERLRSAVSKGCVRPDGEPLTVECGIAEYEPRMTANDLLAHADAALMSLKTGG